MSKKTVGKDVSSDRAGTGIPGLDGLIQGGYPRGGIHIVGGPPGSGKSLFGMQFLIEGAKRGEEGVYVTLEERDLSVFRAMEGFGIDLHADELKGKIVVLDLAKMRATFSEKVTTRDILGFKALVRFLGDTIRVKRPKRVVIDSLVAVGLSYDEPAAFRHDLFVFCDYLREEGITSVLLTETDDEAGQRTRHMIEGFIGDSYISLGLENVKGELRRLITIWKMRFTDHDNVQHPVLIGKGGMTVKGEAAVF